MADCTPYLFIAKVFPRQNSPGDMILCTKIWTLHRHWSTSTAVTFFTDRYGRICRQDSIYQKTLNFSDAL